MRKICRITLSLALLCGAGALQAATHETNLEVAAMQQQEKRITGMVIDTNGEALIGVSILAKKNGIGTITDVDGKFTINVSLGETLQFSYVGYETLEVAVTNKTRNNLEITLKPDTQLLDEVVVVGYGSQSKRNVTGAVSKIKMETMENLPNTSVTQALRGRVAGVQFTDNGRPGQNGTILIRGPRSLSADNNPLIVLDGIIYEGVISDINPSDIASMEILKDASASAIYGSRAANGVILITSKKGTTEKPSVRLNALYGISKANKTLNILSPERYVQKILDYRRETGLPYDENDVASYMAPNEAENYLAGKTIDPLEVGMQDASIHTYDLSISGKSEKVNYYFSANLSKEKGLIKNDNQDRVSFRINLETMITDWLTIGTNSIYARRDYSGVVANLYSIYRSSPYGTLYDEEGVPRQFIVDGETLANNVLYPMYYNSNEHVQNNLFGTFYANIKIPFIEGLSYKFNASPNLRWTHDYSAVKQDERREDDMKTASKKNTNYYNWMVENIINYSRNFGKNHFVDLTLMYSRNAQEQEYSTSGASQLSSDALGWNNLALGTTQTAASGGQKIEGVSYMARLNYRLMDRYLATFTIRRDGSSVFSANNKYATFPSAALSWIISEEEFMKKVDFIDMLKLRVSYGATGNQAISPYQSLNTLGSVNYVYGDGGTTSIGYYPNKMANPNLKWETTYSTNIGLDFQILRGRIGGTIEWYNMQTKDLLMKRTLPAMSGFGNIWTNLGQVDNRGIEVTLNTVNIRTEDFEWSSDITFSHNKNKIVHLYKSDTDGDGKEDDDLGNKWFIGKPITTYYDYVFDGIYQEGDDLPKGVNPGDIRVKDTDGNGSITADDRKNIGQGGQPKFRWGLNNTFRYKNFTLSFFLNAMQGWKGSFSLANGGTPSRSLNFVDMGWWTPENKSQTRPSLTHTNQYNIGWYYSRDFIRIQDVSLSYDVPRSFLNKINLNSLRLFISGKNLYTFTDWPGVDPETGTNTYETSYPMPRTITIGANISF